MVILFEIIMRDELSKLPIDSMRFFLQKRRIHYIYLKNILIKHYFCAKKHDDIPTEECNCKKLRCKDKFRTLVDQVKTKL